MLKVYNNADEFLAENKYLLVPRQMELNLMWMSAHSGKSKEDGFYCAKAENATSCVLAACTSPFPFIVAAFGSDHDELMKEIYSDAVNSIDFSMVIGSMTVIKCFAEQNDRKYEVVENLYLYKLTEVVDIPHTDGKMLKANEIDFDSFKWAVAFCIECNIDVLNSKKEYIKRFIDTGDMYYWVVNNEVVSMAANHRNTENAKVIGYVYTPPVLRGKGYAAALVSQMCRHLLKLTDNVILNADVNNPISNHIYKKIGFNHIGDMSKIKLS